MIRLFLAMIVGFIMAATPAKALSSTDEKNEKPVVLILLGPPGSGKGTQAVELTKAFQIPHISTGDLFRTQIKNETDLGKQVKSYLDKGILVPDDVVLDVIFDRIANPDCKRGYLLDGIPRTSAQAHELEDSLNSKVCFVIFNLKISDEEVIKRLSGRLTCKGCGRIYHKDTNPPAKEGICDSCGGELYQRSDDKPEVIKERLRVYHAQTKPLEEFYRSKGQLIDVDATLPPQEVQKILEAKVKEHCHL